MKQFIRIPKTPEITESLLSDILKGRFPEYKTSIHGNEVRVRKNALTTVCVKCKQERQKTVITIDTKLFWWVWIVVGWIFYLIAKKGFTDEVYSVLVRDLSNRFPNKFLNYPSAYESAVWLSKTKPLFWIGLCIVIWGIIFGSVFSQLVLFLENYILGDWMTAEWRDIHVFIWTKNFWICNLLWILMGMYFMRLKQFGVGKRTGLFLIMSGSFGLLIGCIPYIMGDAFNALFYGEYQLIVNIVIQTCGLILLLYAGYFCKNELQTGPARYFDISISICAISNFVGNVIFNILIQLVKNEEMTLTENQIDSYIVETIVSVVNIIAYFMLLRALHKMPKYPPVKNVSGNAESTEFAVNDVREKDESTELSVN